MSADWYRFEPNNTAESLEPALQAGIADPLWRMLRQMQFEWDSATSLVAHFTADLNLLFRLKQFLLAFSQNMIVHHDCGL